MTVPLESHEQIRLANYLDSKGYLFSAIRNESDYNSIAKGSKRKREWVRKWIPDFCIVLKRWAVLFIELKRCRKILKNWTRWVSPSKVSPEQKHWLKELNKIWNIQGSLCYGAWEAIDHIESLELG